MHLKFAKLWLLMIDIKNFSYKQATTFVLNKHSFLIGLIMIYYLFSFFLNKTQLVEFNFIIVQNKKKKHISQNERFINI